MRRTLIATAVLLVVLLGLPATPAGAAKTTATGITAVVPSATYTTATDDCGTFRVYDAYVTLAWSGTTRVMVYLRVADGTRRAPGELLLSGSGRATVTVPGVIVPQGEGGVFEAYALKWGRGKWAIQSHLIGTTTVSFPA